MRPLAVKWRWLPLLLVRIFIGFVFIQAGLNKLHELDHSRNVLNFFWIAVPPEHRFDPFFPSAGLVCGAFVLLGLVTRVAAIPLIGILTGALFSVHFNELAGLDLPPLQGWVMIFLLAGLCFAGAGSVSVDRFLFRRGTGQTS